MGSRRQVKERKGESVVHRSPEAAKPLGEGRARGCGREIAKVVPEGCAQRVKGGNLPAIEGGCEPITKCRAQAQSGGFEGGARTVDPVATSDGRASDGRCRGAEVQEAPAVDRGIGILAGSVRSPEKPCKEIRVGELVTEILLHQREAARYHRCGEGGAVPGGNAARAGPGIGIGVRNRRPERPLPGPPGNSLPQFRTGWRNRKSHRPLPARTPR